MSNDEISTLAVNAMMDKLAFMVSKGKPNKGLTEDEHAFLLAHVAVEVSSLAVDGVIGKTDKTPGRSLLSALSVAMRATKNGSQMRQVAEKRKILEVSQTGDKVDDMAAQYGV